MGFDSCEIHIICMQFKVNSEQFIPFQPASISGEIQWNCDFASRRDHRDVEWFGLEGTLH